MKAFKFFKVDFLRCKTQLMLLTGMMVLFAVIFTYESKNILFAIGYLSFLAVMFSVQPFALESKDEAGFIDMLPGRVNDRVYGRFLYTIFAIGISILISAGNIAIYVAMGNTVDSTTKLILVFILGGIFTLSSIEILLLYALGKGRSQQFMTFAQMAPAIVLFLGACAIGEYFEKHPEIDISWFTNHQNAIAGGFLVFGLVFFVITIQIAKAIVRKRDFE